MPRPSTRFGVTAAITLLFFCAVVVAASAIRLAGDLNGRLGFVFFLLIMLAPVFIAAGVAVAVWRLTLRLPPYFGVLERVLFAFASFVITCGSGPLAISLAVMAITRHEGAVGAAGIWALMSVATSVALSVFGIAVTVLRALYGRHTSQP